MKVVNKSLNMFLNKTSAKYTAQADWQTVKQIKQTVTDPTQGREKGSHVYLPAQQTPCAPGSSLAPALHSASPWPLNRLQSRLPCQK